MFRFLNKIIKNNYARRTLSSSGGQAAIILILVIAASLIYYVASANFGEISDVKALVTVASDTSAGLLASYMASWGERLSQEYLKGDDQFCESTGLFAAIITLVVVIIASIITLGMGAPWALAALSIAVSTASVVMQATIIQPQITEAWNSITQDHLETGNQFSEQAISNALAKAVTDTVQVPDLTDLDRDTKWVRLSDLNKKPYADTVSRFSIYYDRRINQITGTNVDDVGDFLRALDHLLYQGEDGWGIHDHLNPSACGKRAECQPCCYPKRSSKCYEDGSTADDWARECRRASPYGNTARPYPWMFDPTYENPDNTFYSLRELIGKDDQHKDYFKDPNKPNSEPPPAATPQHLYDNWAPGYKAFQLEDATGFYVDPPYTSSLPDNRKGIFPFFHKLSEWGVNLADVETDKPGGFVSFPKECHWYCSNPLYPGCIADCNTAFREGPHDHPLEIPQLSLPVDPAILQQNTTPNVDGSNDAINPGEPPLWVDKVTAPGSILADDTVCAMNTLYPPGDEDNPDPSIGFWREGTDQFCAPPDIDPTGATTWPYSAGCAHQAKGDCDDPSTLFYVEPCGCGEGTASPAEYPDDDIDRLYSGLGDFILWAENLFTLDLTGNTGFNLLEAFGAINGNDFSSLRALYQQAVQLPLFYDKVYRWIEPNTTNWRYPSSGVIATRESPLGGRCFVCEGLTRGNTGHEGRLFVFLKTMFRMRNRIFGWIVNHDWTVRTDDPISRIGWVDPDNNPTRNLVDDNVGYAGNDCNEVWCVPRKDLDCPLIQRDERTTFNANKDVTGYEAQGDVEDIVACLDHNANHDITLTDFPYGGNPFPSDYKGNAQRFSACFNGCNACQEGYDPNGDNNPLDSDATFCTAAVNEACGGTDDTYLPRTLLPGFDPNGAFVPIKTPRLQNLLNCRQSCLSCYSLASRNQRDCTDLCNVPNPPPGCNCDATGFCPCPNNAQSCKCEELDCVDRIVSVPVPPNPNPPYTTPPEDKNSQEWLAAITDAYGSCKDASDAPDSFLNLINRSIPEAANQVAKFKKRLDFLSGRLREINNFDGRLPAGTDILSILDTAIDKLEAFLVGKDSPSQLLIQRRIEHNIFQDIGLPYQAIYGWRSEAPYGETQRGKWHIVKVEARLPGRCDNACNVFQIRPPFAMDDLPDLSIISDFIKDLTLGLIDVPDLPDLSSLFDPEWPDIDTHQSGFLGTKRCFDLINKEGIVKFRTTRYDEKTGLGNLRFPNGAKIWDFRFGYPGRKRDTTPNLLESACKVTPGIPNNKSPTMTTMPNGDALPPGSSVYDGAFIMNEYLISRENEECWKIADELLSTGIVSETCAAYYWDDSPEITLPGTDIAIGGGKRMRFIFVNCNDF